MNEDEVAKPTLVIVVGPPAVGKMTVGQALAERTGFRLFHNHVSIELAWRYFDYGAPGLSRISEGIRDLVFSEVAASDLPGLIFTGAWRFSVPADHETVARYTRPFRERGSRVVFVELETTQEVRLARNETPLRLVEKPSKRDLEGSRAHLLEQDTRHRFNTHGELDGRADWLRIDNTHLSPQQVAQQVVEHFGLGGADS
jgi:hypothetical protein